MAKLLVAVSLLLAQANADNQSVEPAPANAPQAQADGQADPDPASGDAEPGGEGESKESGEAKKKPAADGRSGGIPAFIPLIVICGLFYLIMFAPDRKKRARLQQQLGQLSTNDRVVTIGGILGTVARVNKDAEEVTLILDESNNTRMKIVRSAIRQIIVDEEPKQ